MIRITFRLLIFLFVFLALSGSATATTIFSPVLELEADPGQIQPGVVKVYNETDQPIFLVASVEEFSAGDETGQPIYIPADERKDFLDWFKVGQTELTLVPGQVAIVPFTVTIPATAVPGGYYAVIFWQTASGSLGGDTAVGVSSRVGTLVLLKVKGDVIELGEIAEFNTSAGQRVFFGLPLSFVVRFSNLGNVHLAPQGTIELKNWLGQTKKLKVNPGQRNVLPQSIRRFEVSWGQSLTGNLVQNFWTGLKQELSHFSLGKYKASLNLSYGFDTPQTLTQELEFWVIPVRLISSFIVALVLLIFLIKFNLKINKLKKQTPKLDNAKQE